MPTRSTISALGERDVAADGKQSFGLLLEYSFKQADACEVGHSLTWLWLLD